MGGVLVRAVRWPCAVMCLVFVGCGTANVNPVSPRANTGYVDFYTDSNLALSWEVKRTDESTGKSSIVFSDFKPLQTSVLRLASPPGKYRFQVWFMNKVTDGPEIVEVQIESGKITPVHLTLTAAGSGTVVNRTYGISSYARGYRYGTTVEKQESEMLKISLNAQDARDYEPKERMPYFAQ
jgi:hypothetical protein